MARTVAFSFVVMLAPLAVVACGDPSCDDYVSPCAPRVDLQHHCAVSSACFVQGTPVADTLLEPNEVLAVSLAGLEDGFVAAHDIFTTYVAGEPKVATPGPPDIRNVIVRLDGVVGVHVGPAVRGGLYGETIRWDPVPAFPSLLEVHYEDAVTASRTVLLWLEDAECEDENPPPVCEL